MSDDNLDAFEDIDVFERSPFEDIDPIPYPQPAVVSTPVVLRPPDAPVETPETPDELPFGLIYRSKDGGTGNGHVVIVQANDELTCTCWPALRQVPRGCHAMRAARQLLGLPPV